MARRKQMAAADGISGPASAAEEEDLRDIPSDEQETPAETDLSEAATPTEVENSENSDGTSDLLRLTGGVARTLDADVIFHNGPIGTPQHIKLAKVCANRVRRKNVVFLLTTWGGDPDAAYRIARCLQQNYARFYLCVSGLCKSAGTIIALGAHELIVSECGEVGPLDVQMSKKDDLLKRQSGQTVSDALKALQIRAFEAFEHFFLTVYQRGQAAITVQTSAQIATEMASGLFAPLYGQLDPLHIGEAGRAMSIAREYGQRLLDRGKNIDEGALERLILSYPSHRFVIDREEAKTLFKVVREPSESESALIHHLGSHAIVPKADPDSVPSLISPPPAPSN